MDDEIEQSSGRPKYRDKLTERFAKGERVKQFQNFKEQAERRLDLQSKIKATVPLFFRRISRQALVCRAPIGRCRRQRTELRK